MANRYNIVITAQDAATARIRAIKRSVSDLLRPLSDTAKSARALGKETGISKLGASLLDAGKGAGVLLRSLGGVGGALAGAIGVGSISALAVWSKQWANANSQVLRTSASIGVAAREIQSLENVGKLAGLDPGAVTNSLQQLGTTLQDARWGRNQQALLFMNRLGMRLKYTKDGAIDTKAGLLDLADTISKMNAPVQTKAMVAQVFGVEQLLPLLLKGRQGFVDLQREADKVKPPLSEEQLRRADAYRKSIDKLGLSFDALGNSIMERAMPSLTAVSDWFVRHNNQAAENVQRYGFWGATARGAAKYNADFFKMLWRGVTFDFSRSPKSTLGALISKGEGGYNSVNLGRAGGYKAARMPLETMTVRQVMEAQAAGAFNAAGAYQITRPTMKEAVKGLGIDPDKTKFDMRTQDRIFQDYLLKMKRPAIAAYISGQSNDLHAALKSAALEWASFADPDTGKSAYDGVANNKASIPAVDVAKALMQARGTEPWTRAEVREQAPAGSFREPGLDASGLQGSPGALADVWKGGAKPAPSQSTVRLELVAPPGTKAEVVSTKGPVKTELKVEYSMPDFSL